jgi:membrane associated rhomboid family serine protease
MTDHEVRPSNVGVFLALGFFGAGALAGLLLGHFLLGASAGAVIGFLVGLNVFLFLTRRQRDARRSQRSKD